LLSRGIAAISSSAPPTEAADYRELETLAEETMKLLSAATAAAIGFALAGPASAAVTVKNTSSGEFTIGVDLGSSEKVETIPAGKEVKVDCKDGCGITGPWGFSWFAKGDDVISSNGQALVTVQEK
jgi:hypothetical protein